MTCVKLDQLPSHVSFPPFVLPLDNCLQLCFKRKESLLLVDFSSSLPSFLPFLSSYERHYLKMVVRWSSLKVDLVFQRPARGYTQLLI